MADLEMPASLWTVGWDSLRWEPALNNAIRSQMVGGFKKRKRFTFVPQKLTCSLYLPAAALQVLEDFHDITCEGGVLPFTWWDFRKPNDTDKRATYEFLSRPAHATHLDIYRADLELLMTATFTGTFGLGLFNENDEELTT